MQMRKISVYLSAFLLGCGNPTGHGTQPEWESLSGMSHMTKRYFIPTERVPYTQSVTARRNEFNLNYPIFDLTETVEFEGNDRLHPASPRREVTGFTSWLPGDFCDNPYNFARLRAELEGIKTGVTPDFAVRRRIRREGGRLVVTYPDQEECIGVMDLDAKTTVFTPVSAP